MRVLILSVTAGGGHHAAAEAISEELQSRNVTTLVLDIYEFTNMLLYNAIDKGYSLSIRYAPPGYRVLYNVLEGRSGRESTVPIDPVAIINKLSAMRFRRFAEVFSPDCIICTHPLAAQVVNGLKAQHKIDIPCIGIVTDFTILPYWEDCPTIEQIVVANELLVYRAVKRGIAHDRLLPTGIPIKPKFAQSIPKLEARMQVGISMYSLAVLVMSGSMGHGDMATLTNDLLALSIPIEIVVVCGKNEQLYQTLVEKSAGPSANGRLHVIGYTDQIDILMDAVDCIISKPGGLTVSESLAKSLPMILVSPIPGQEERNIEFLLNIGAALRATKTLTVDEAVFYLFENPERLRVMQESIDLIKKPNATSDLADFVIKNYGTGATAASVD